MWTQDSDYCRTAHGPRASISWCAAIRQKKSIHICSLRRGRTPARRAIRCSSIRPHRRAGQVPSKGVARGKVVIAPMMTNTIKIKEVIALMKRGDILVAESTTPELMSLCNLASAIVTNQGGMLSHAAVVSRELKIPCIIDTKNATEVLKDGDVVEVDANRGEVKIIKTYNKKL